MTTLRSSQRAEFSSKIYGDFKKFLFDTFHRSHPDHTIRFFLLKAENQDRDSSKIL